MRRRHKSARKHRSSEDVSPPQTSPRQRKGEDTSPTQTSLRHRSGKNSLLKGFREKSKKSHRYQRSQSCKDIFASETLLRHKVNSYPVPKYSSLPSSSLRRYHSDNQSRRRDSPSSPVGVRLSSPSSVKRHHQDDVNKGKDSSSPVRQRHQNDDNKGKKTSSPAHRRHRSAHHNRSLSKHRSKHKSRNLSEGRVSADDEIANDAVRGVKARSATTNIPRLGGRTEKPSLWVDGVPRVCAPFVNMPFNGRPASLNDGTYPATKEVATLVELFRDEIVIAAVKKGHTLSTSIMALSYKLQTVAGTNYFIKVRIGDEYCHVCIYQSPEGKLRLAGLEPNMALADEIRYMICIKA